MNTQRRKRTADYADGAGGDSVITTGAGGFLIEDDDLATHRTGMAIIHSEEEDNNQHDFPLETPRKQQLKYGEAGNQSVYSPDVGLDSEFMDIGHQSPPVHMAPQFAPIGSRANTGRRAAPRPQSALRQQAMYNDDDGDNEEAEFETGRGLPAATPINNVRVQQQKSASRTNTRMTATTAAAAAATTTTTATATAIKPKRHIEVEDYPVSQPRQQNQGRQPKQAIAADFPGAAEYIAQVESAFDKFDSLTNGNMPKADIKKVLHALRVPGLGTESSISDFVNNQIKAISGKVSRHNFVKAILPFYEEIERQKRMENAFDLFVKTAARRDLVDDSPPRGGANDTRSAVSNSRNGITVDSLRRVARILREEISEEELREMMDLADVDGDGVVNMNDFKMIMERANIF
ncbi:hypothetical protein GQ42DRAFT_161239 [Ramicandelaber brevisporus]|nr:hypothetical protein GQ42DRAFT_161239 [Ramicandelaber brevisporus]